ncbi:MAG: hypothetical protein E7Z87_04645 [Cyanobacteria bacterium SIG26]|nr:hypothetical protein [Cyanobacteria bacterium SIG26]
MKKFLVLVILCSLPTIACAKSYIDAQLDEIDNNLKYNTVQVHELNYQLKDIQFDSGILKNLKDPKLIKLNQYNEVSDTEFDAKIAKDEQFYKSKIEPLFSKKTAERRDQAVGVDYYQVYRVAERLIRANNLDYINWRIAVRKTQSFNASTSDGNYVEINTGLYDTLYQNEDAFAYVLAHEMAHQILGHSRRTQDLELELKTLKSNYKKDSTYRVIRTKYIYKELRKMEYMADTEGQILLIKAGYSPYKAIEAINFMVSMDSTKEKVLFNHNTHPHAMDRFNSFEENIKVADPNWIGQGRENIYNSNPLACKKSSDRVSFVIVKSKNSKNFYNVETLDQRLTRIAYVKYLRGDFEDAIKYFDKLLDEDGNNYVAYLYKSYSNEAIYNKTNKKRFLKRAISDAEKVLEISPNNEYAKKQLDELIKL